MFLSIFLVLKHFLLLLRKNRLENAVGFTELLNDLWSLLTVARGVVSWVHWIYDLELHLIVLRH